MAYNTNRLVLAFSVSALTLLAVSGCNKNPGADMSADEYKKAAMGSKMPPEQEAAMRAAIKKNEAEAAANNAAAAAADANAHK